MDVQTDGYTNTAGGAALDMVSAELREEKHFLATLQTDFIDCLLRIKSSPADHLPAPSDRDKKLVCVPRFPPHAVFSPELFHDIHHFLSAFDADVRPAF